jgi:phosphate transport system substrate-binding protein
MQLRANSTVASSEKVIEVIESQPFAIGFASLGLAQQAAAIQPIRLLPLGDVPATLENVRNGRYPLVRPLQLVTRDEPQGIVKEFIDYARSPEVHDLIKTNGFVDWSP